MMLKLRDLKKLRYMSLRATVLYLMMNKQSTDEFTFLIKLLHIQTDPAVASIRSSSVGMDGNLDL